jgi:hypothetical protein
MSELSNYALELQPTNDIVCAYASKQVDLLATGSGAAERWIEIGAFQVPVAVRARLTAIGLVSVLNEVEIEVKIWADGVPMTHSELLVNQTSESTYVSVPIDLIAGVAYQIGASCRATVAASANHFGTVRTTSLGAP